MGADLSGPRRPAWPRARCLGALARQCDRVVRPLIQFGLAQGQTAACRAIANSDKSGFIRIELDRRLILPGGDDHDVRDRRRGAIERCHREADSSRFWPAEEVAPGAKPTSFDKQVLRDWLSATDWDKRPPPPALPESVVEQTAATYRDIYRRLCAAL